MGTENSLLRCVYWKMEVFGCWKMEVFGCWKKEVFGCSSQTRVDSYPVRLKFRLFEWHRSNLSDEFGSSYGVVIFPREVLLHRNGLYRQHLGKAVRLSSTTFPVKLTGICSTRVIRIRRQGHCVHRRGLSIFIDIKWSLSCISASQDELGIILATGTTCLVAGPFRPRRRLRNQSRRIPNKMKARPPTCTNFSE